jgi:hypothetical protein
MPGRRHAEAIEERNNGMMDVVYIAVTIGFFVIAAGYVYFCDKI